jgi:hypothetical protein
VLLILMVLAMMMVLAMVLTLTLFSFFCWLTPVEIIELKINLRLPNNVHVYCVYIDFELTFGAFFVVPVTAPAVTPSFTGVVTSSDLDVGDGGSVTPCDGDVVFDDGRATVGGVVVGGSAATDADASTACGCTAPATTAADSTPTDGAAVTCGCDGIVCNDAATATSTSDGPCTDAGADADTTASGDGGDGDDVEACVCAATATVNGSDRRR